MTLDQLYASTIFLNAAVPLIKVVANDVPSLQQKFAGKTFTAQILFHDEEGDKGTHLIVTDGEWEVKKGIADSYDIGLIFKNVQHFINFFSGRAMLPLPKLYGLSKLGLFVPFLQVLLKMSGLLQAKNAPKKVEDKRLLVKLYFYLLSAGISQLNKVGHEEVHGWALKSPDRVYAFAVKDMPELGAYIRVKAGNSRAGRGEYTRSKPFFTLGFRDLDSALGILMQKDDMIESTAQGKLIMGGAPEFGAQIGGFMMTIAAYAK